MKNTFTFLENNENSHTNQQSLRWPKMWLTLLALLFCTSITFAQNEYITLWQSDNPGDSGDTQITIPASGTFDYTWEEDGNPSNSGNGNGDNATTIDFATPGTYVVKITPTGAAPFNRITFSNEGDKKKLKEIQQWGSTQWSSFEEAYNSCENLNVTATDIPDLVNVSTMVCAFCGTGISIVPNMNEWDVSNVTDMSTMFAFASAFSQDIGNWDIGNVTEIGDMFYRASSFNQDIGGWDVSNVLNMHGMFGFASAFNQDISGWDVGSVMEMSGMFNLASSFNQDIGGWNLNSLTTASYMLFESGLDCINYSKTLRGWASNPNTAHGIGLGADALSYSPNVIPYRDQLIDDFGWNITGDYEGSCVLGVAGLELTELEIYPNPVIDFVHISGLEGKENISLYDINGRLLQNLKVSGNESQLDLSPYAEGIYLLKISSDKGNMTQKIIKQ